MARKTSPYVVGDHWLDRRRDGRAEHIWQIAGYTANRRSIVYKSTGTGDLEAAKAVIHAFVQAERAKGPQTSEDAEVLPQLFLYWREHGCNARNPDTIAGSLRAFIGFLLQDEVGVRVRFGGLTRSVFRRFKEWRKLPHSFTVDWFGKEITTNSKGVKGESVQRNFDDIRAALRHAVDRERVPSAPRVPSVPKAERSPPRDVRMSLETLGSLIGYASQVARFNSAPDVGLGRWLWLMIGTACRPDAALAFLPEVQWDGFLVDLHPPDWPRTKKHNPVVPAPPLLARMLDAWKSDRTWQPDPAKPPRSRKTSFRTMRRVLRLPPEIVPKTIRHTIATELRRRGVSGAQLSMLLGHRPVDMERTTEGYAKFDPEYLREVLAPLQRILLEVDAHARRWSESNTVVRRGRGAIDVEPRT